MVVTKTNGSVKAPKINIAIIGCGIGGLCLAKGLLSNPFLAIQVYEGTARYGDIGGGLALHLNAIRAMDLIHPSIRPIYFAKALSMAEEEDTLMATRVIMATGPHQGLHSLVPADLVHFGKRLAKIEEKEEGKGIIISFTDGSTVTADAVIGADGIHSVIRRFVLGEDHPAAYPVNHDGWQTYQCKVPMDVAKQVVPEQWTTTVPILCGPLGYFNCMPINKGKILSVSLVTSSRVVKIPENGNLPFEADDLAGYNQDARAIAKVLGMHADRLETWALQDHDAAPVYSHHRVAMMGDAAHATFPFSGQGAAQAIEDAAVLNAVFTHVTDLSQVSAALKAYDVTRRPRSQRVVEMTRKFGRIYADMDESMVGQVELQTAYFKKEAPFTNNVDLEAQNANAVEKFFEFSKKE